MNDLLIKVCGMRDYQNIKELILFKPNFMGFIFYEKSKRFINVESIEESIASVPKEIKKVGVFVDESEEQIIDSVKKYALDYVQLHGNENLELCETLNDNGIKIIKVFSVDENFDFNETEEFESIASFFIFDTKGDGYGGHGVKFDWNLLKKYNQKVPFLLAGGISLENIIEIKMLKGLNLLGLDVNSKFEVSPGLKDINKLEKLFQVVRTI